MSAGVPSARVLRRLGLAVGILLLLPEVVLAVLVVHLPIVVGLAGFAMTIGWIRLGTLAYRVGRQRVPPLHRGATAGIGVVGLVVGGALFTGTTAAAQAVRDPAYAAALAPPAVVGLNLLVIASAGVYVVGAVLLVASALGAIADARSRRPAA